MTLEARPTGISGCWELVPPIHADPRGRFVKIFSSDWFGALDLETEFKEDYYSVSRQGVIRGLHFQAPPMAHAKLVYCLAGAVFDVALDLRKGSPGYGRHVVCELTDQKANMLYIPSGMAHGFCVLSDQAILGYKVASVHSTRHDCGIRWDSAGISWPCERPLLSGRDLGLPPLQGFDSPFVYE